MKRSERVLQYLITGNTAGIIQASRTIFGLIYGTREPARQCQGKGAMGTPQRLETEVFCRDPKDDFLLALAKLSKANYLVTGDGDLLELKIYHRTRIVTIDEFEKVLTKAQNLTRHHPNIVTCIF